MELKEQTEFIKILDRNGFFAYKVNASRKGVPDIEAVKDKVSRHFEAKSLGGSTSRQQKRLLLEVYLHPYAVMKVEGKFFVWGEPFEIHKKEDKIIFAGSLRSFLNMED